MYILKYIVGAQRICDYCELLLMKDENIYMSSCFGSFLFLNGFINTMITRTHTTINIFTSHRRSIVNYFSPVSVATIVWRFYLSLNLINKPVDLRLCYTIVKIEQSRYKKE